MKRALPVLVFLLVASCGSERSQDLWESSTIYEAKQEGRLRIGTEPLFPPFEYIENGELVGFDIDLAREIGKEMGVEVEFIQMDFDGIIAALTTGRCDLIISGMTATPQRALRVSYTDPYFHTITCLLCSKGRGADVKSIEDLNREGRRVMVKLGTTGHEAAKTYCPKAEIVPLKIDEDLAAEVAADRADAFLFDKRQIEAAHAKYPDKTFVVARPVSVEPYSIACRKGEPDTLEWLNLVLRQMRLDGRLEELYAKYNLQDAGG